MPQRATSAAVTAVTALLAAQVAWALPSGTNGSVNTTEEAPVILTPAHFGFTDPNGHSFSQVWFPTQASSGIIAVGNQPIEPAVPVTLGSLTSGQVTWQPANNSAGPAAASVTFQVENNLGEKDPAPKTLSLNIAPVNDPPIISTEILHNGNFASGLSYWIIAGNIVFAYGGLAFNAGDMPPNGVATQTISTTAGNTYQVNLSTVRGGFPTPQQSIAVDIVDAASGAVISSRPYGQDVSDTFSFVAVGASTIVRVRDTSSITVSTDIALPFMSIKAPGADAVGYEDNAIVWSQAIGRPLALMDPDGPAGAYTFSLTVTHGTLKLATLAGITVTAGADGSSSMTLQGTQAAINAALDGLQYLPDANYHGPAALTLNANDNGNTGTGGPLAATPAVVPITVLPVNDPPAGQSAAFTVAEDSSHTFSAANFGFADPVDSPANALAGVRIEALPGNGVLALAGVPVNAGQLIPAANLGSLTWTPAPNSHGTPLTSFPFRVQDDGGTANGGIDTSPTANTITFNVTASNDPPVAVDDSTSAVAGGPAVSITPLANDSDPDGDVLQITSINGTTLTQGTAQTIAVPQGTVTVTASGAITFQPGPAFTGSSFPYTISDGNGGTASATINVTVGTAVPVPVGGAGFAALLSLALAGLGWRRARR